MLLILGRVRHIKTEGSRTSREPFFKPWLLWPLGKCSNLGTQDLEGIQFPEEGLRKLMFLSFHPWGTGLSSPSLHRHELSRKRAAKSTWFFSHWTTAFWVDDHKCYCSIFRGWGKGMLERDFRDSIAGSPSVIELGTGGSRKSTSQVRQFSQRPQTEELPWSVSQTICSKEKLPRSEAKVCSFN